MAASGNAEEGGAGVGSDGVGGGGGESVVIVGGLVLCVCVSVFGYSQLMMTQ